MSIVLDTREFDQALVQYAAASNKDFADIVNRQTMNLAIQGLKLQKKAESQKIRAIKKLEWWPKYVAKVISKTKGTKFGSKVFQAGWSKSQKRELSKSQEGYINYAKEFGEKLIRRRLVATGFLKFFFIKMAQAVQPFTDRPARSGKSFAGFEANIKPATKDNPAMNISVSYTYRKRGDKTAKSAELMLQKVLPMAITATLADIRQYIDRKMGYTAKKYSARGAA